MSKSSSGLELEWKNACNNKLLIELSSIGAIFQAIYKSASPSATSHTEGKLHRLVIHHLVGVLSGQKEQ